MKKSLAGCFILLLILPLASAVEFDVKDKFDLGETFLAKVSGNFLKPVLKENIFFYRGHVRIATNPDVEKIQGEFYIHAILPENPNNYSIIIEDVQYMQGSKVIDADLNKSFEITNETADFSVTPGAISTDGDFSLEVQNLNDAKLEIRIETTDVSGETGFFASLFGGVEDDDGLIEVKSGEIKKINFNVDKGEEPTLKTIKLSSENTEYSIPVYIFSTAEEEPEKKEFQFESSWLNVSLPTGVERQRIVYLENTGNVDLEDIELSLSDSLKPYIIFDEENITKLDEDENFRIELQINSSDEEKVVAGELMAKSGDLETSLGITLNFILDFNSTEPLVDPDFAKTKTCEELGGEICDDDETCSDDIPTYAEDGVCCMTFCKSSRGTSSGKFFGWLLVILVIAFIVWFYFKKYKGV